MTEATPIEAEIPLIDVRTIAPGERHHHIFSTLDALAPGELLRITSDHDPRPLHYQLESGYPGKFSWDYLEQGPQIWRVEISRLEAGCECSCRGH
ncbi:DUF2249 domain-containing protein [Rhizobium jaguaris]|uniref:DUF2249 domain-containing protein n=1 Tax=Rhizobium jaguaris TaxID=1312183 RepID=UPI0039BEF353